MGYAVGKLAQCLGIPFVKPLWEYAITDLVADFKFGHGLNRRSEWQDLNEIFQNAVIQGYQATLMQPDLTKETTVVRSIKEEQASDSGHPDNRGGGTIANDDLSMEDDEICELMTDIWKYACPRDVEASASGEAVSQEECLNNVNTFRDLEILDSSDGCPLNQATPGDPVPEESSGIDAVRYTSAFNEFRVHNAFNGRYAMRPKMVDTLHIQPSRQLPPSDKQGNDQTKMGETLYEHSWTGM